MHFTVSTLTMAKMLSDWHLLCSIDSISIADWNFIWHSSTFGHVFLEHQSINDGCGDFLRRKSEFFELQLTFDKNRTQTVEQHGNFLSTNELPFFYVFSECAQVGIIKASVLQVFYSLIAILDEEKKVPYKKQ